MILPYLTMQAAVVVQGKMPELLYFKSVSSIEITENLKEIGSTASIVLPRFYQQFSDKSPLDFIKCGDKVWISFGYLETNTAGTLEFEGYISEIGSDTPLEIKCDQLYPLRQNDHNESFKSVKLREVLNYITKGTFIKRVECPDVNLGKYEINHKSTYQELVKLKEQFGFFSRISGETLRVGFAFDWKANKTANHVYQLQTNVRKSELSFKREHDFNVRLRVNIKKGQNPFLEKGSTKADATLRTAEYNAESDADAQKVLDSMYRQAVYDGFRGSISGFGFPVTNAGDSLTIKDKKDPSRDGVYLIEKVQKTYGPGGIIRRNELAFKLVY